MSNIEILNREIISAHQKHFETSPTGLVHPTESPNGNNIYHLYSDGEITFQKGGWAYLQRSEFTHWNNYANSNCKKLNLTLPETDAKGRTYAVLTPDECTQFRSRMIELTKK